MTKTAEALPMALAQIDDWEQMGLLDGEWARTFKGVLRANTGPERRGVNVLQSLIQDRTYCFGALRTLLDLIHDSGVRFDEDERDVVMEIVERIGWEPS